MTNTLQIAKELRSSEFSQKQAEALADLAIRLEERSRDQMVTRDYLDARLGTQKTSLIIWVIGTQIAATGLLLATRLFT